MPEAKRVMLLDSASLYFRAFYGVPESVTAPDGMPVNAVRGFTDMVSTLITRYRPTDFVACLDYDWRPAFRVDLVPSYKAHRVMTETADGEPDVEETPDLLAPQVPVLLEVLKAAGLCSVGAAGFEADDVIATLAHRHDQRGELVDVVSGDRDLIDLTTERVRVLYTGKGIAKIVEFTPDEVRQQYGVPAEHYADFAILRGDPSDGLPGVAGIGVKTAAIVVSEFGPIEQIVAAAESGDKAMSASVRAKVLAARDYLAVAPAVVRGRQDVPVPELDTAIPAAPADLDMLAALAEQFGIGSATGRLTTALEKLASLR
ncbi:5'-3' exonuclease [Jatrophihabitans lederbergiae]|uniref:5'-3' exonuclease n=1 Tax=Jatrophihabitans lederbergiae TaxID=3075547 RepID=A0ABU2JD20_9ACTN|nr:5'-3' exonuclease [Jatrophihabitans sp. DSM 44399]MDT0262865.1 5'-3' exonuclease [Jatrophihabitans sp. DSM 44399]